jgi:Glycosyltransferase family 87
MIVASPDRSDAAIRTTSEGNPHARAMSDMLLLTLPLLFVVVMMWGLLHDRFSALDFREAYWLGGHRVLAGQNPYLWTAAQFRGGVAFVYPALSAVLFAPTALLSRSGGAFVFTLVSACVAPATLALLRVRDWRVYAVTLVWLPIYAGWLTANESLFMALGLAGAWRWRDRPWVAGFLTAAMISLKPLLWPLALWLLATRRWRASATTLVWGLLLNAFAWSVVGFGDIGSYLHAVSADTEGAWRLGFGVPALLGYLGAGRTAAMAVMMIASAVLVAAILHSGLARRNEVQALTLTVALAIVSSPLLWDHYLALLLVPLALLRPRLGWVWFLPVLMWICPPDARARLWQVACFWLAGGLMLTALSLQAARLSAPASRLFGMSWLAQARA